MRRRNVVSSRWESLFERMKAVQARVIISLKFPVKLLDFKMTLLRSLPSLYQRTQRLILLHKWRDLRVLRYNDIAHDPRKHDTSPLVEMRIILVRKVVLICRRRANRIHVVLRSNVQVGILDAVGSGYSNGRIPLHSKVLHDFGTGEGSPGQRSEQNGRCACGLDFCGKFGEVGFVLLDRYATGLFLVVMPELLLSISSSLL
jgi:hypothetical protein